MRNHLYKHSRNLRRKYAKSSYYLRKRKKKYNQSVKSSSSESVATPPNNIPWPLLYGTTATSMSCLLQPSWHQCFRHLCPLLPHPPMSHLWIALAMFLQQPGGSRAFPFPTKQKSLVTKPEELFSCGGECDYACWSWSQVGGCCSSRAWDRRQWCTGSSAYLCSSPLRGSLLTCCFYFIRRQNLPDLLHSSRAHTLQAFMYSREKNNLEKTSCLLLCHIF